MGAAIEGTASIELPVVETTLLELVRVVSEVTEDDREVVATVLEMLRSGRVRLCGTLHDERLDAA